MAFEEYYFIFGLAFLFTLFASIQDFRRGEVSNWLNFSLLAFIVAYRAFYSYSTQDWNFLIFGLIGFALFFTLANGLYYAKAFGGGDAKLLMGYGAALPYYSYSSILILGFGFIVLFFLIGSVYTLIYSAFLAYANGRDFAGEFFKNWKKDKYLLIISALLSLIFIVVYYSQVLLWLAFSIFAFLMPLLYSYLRSMDRCMIKLKDPWKLSVGDWLERDVKIGNKWIRKSVHGLSLKDIQMLKKARKKVFVKEGIPFTIVFLFSLILSAFLILKYLYFIN